jgi:hypothetical protein
LALALARHSDVEHHRPQIGRFELVGAQHFQLRRVDLLFRVRHRHVENLGRVEQAPRVLVQAEDGRALGRLIGADALEAADAVVQRVGQDVRGALAPGLEGAIEPDESVTVGKAGHLSSLANDQAATLRPGAEL